MKVSPELRIAWSFVRSHFGASMAIMGSIILVMCRAAHRSTLTDQVKTEVFSQTAVNDIHHVALQQGIESAHMAAEREYQERKENLSQEQQSQAEKLRADPAALVSFVIKAGSKKP